MFAEEIFLTITPTGVLTFNTVYGWSGHWSKNDINKWVRALEFLSVSSGAQHPWLLSMVNFLSLNTRVDTCSKLDLVSLAPGTGPGLTCDPSVTNFSPSLEFFILELKVNIFSPLWSGSCWDVSPSSQATPFLFAWRMNFGSMREWEQQVNKTAKRNRYGCGHRRIMKNGRHES